MYEKILTSLKTKYKHLGLEENYLKVVARRMASTVKEESEIENAVNDVNDELAYAQSQADLQRTLKKQLEDLQKSIKAKGGDDTPPATPPTDPATPPLDGGEAIPAWAKVLVESNAVLSENLANLTKERTTQANKQKLLSKLEELGVKENFYKFHVTGKTFESDDQIAEFATSIKESHDAFLQENANKGLKGMSNPIFSDSSVQKEVSSAAQHYINQNKKDEQSKSRA